MHDFYKVLDKISLTESAFILRFERKNIRFNAGQYLSVGLAKSEQARDYSIFSAEEEPYLEILVKIVENGIVSKQLSTCKKGDLLRISGPKGTFTLNTANSGQQHILIATGTGISPLHSIVKSNHELKYKIFHGIRYHNEMYGANDFLPDRYIPCISRENQAAHKGHVTDIIAKETIEKDAVAYLCGNGDMIFEVFEILVSKGLSTNQINTEIYF